MSAGLFRLGRDFGNGAVDGLCFQRDGKAEEYRRAKERVLINHPDRLCALDDEGARELEQCVLKWMVERLKGEHPITPEAYPLEVPQRSSTRLDFKGLSLAIQEDFALLEVDENGEDRLVLLSVCFPSGWRPETLLGKGFAEVHAPVPEFDELSKQRSQLVRAMTERGPYVRFVWSLAADDRLDHHPVHAPRDAWKEGGDGFLRVERQVTVPFPRARGSLFLIRTYLYPIKELSSGERRVLHQVVASLPASVRSYKGLSAATDSALAER